MLCWNNTKDALGKASPALVFASGSAHAAGRIEDLIAMQQHDVRSANPAFFIGIRADSFRIARAVVAKGEKIIEG